MSHPLFEQIVAATAGEYAIIGELGATAGATAFLARDAGTGGLVVLSVPAGAESLEVLAALGDEVPANAGRCTACGYPPMLWLSHCPNCRRPFVLGTVGAHRFSLDEVRAAVEHAYDVEGEIAHLAGGSLFFVRDRVDHRLVALAGQVDADGQQVLEAVWDATGTAPDPQFAAAAGTADPASADPFGGAAGSWTPAGAPDARGFVDPGPPPPPRRRGWMPVAIVAGLVVVAGGAWAVLHGGGGPAAPTTVATGTVADPGAGGTPPGTGTATATRPSGATAGPTPDAGSPRPDVRPPDTSPTVADSIERLRRHAADSARQAGRAWAFLQIAGEPPGGWVWRIDGRAGPPSKTARLRPHREHVIELEAPGYCPDVLRLTPEPASTQQWTPRLRGKPMIGDCQGTPTP